MQYFEVEYFSEGDRCMKRVELISENELRTEQDDHRPHSNLLDNESQLYRRGG